MSENWQNKAKPNKNSDNKIIQGNAKLFDKSDCQNGQISQTMKQKLSPEEQAELDRQIQEF